MGTIGGPVHPNGRKIGMKALSLRRRSLTLVLLAPAGLVVPPTVNVTVTP